MNCPLCSVDLQMSERSGVEIDYCPKCRGVWLDRGELDKIIALSGPSGPPQGRRYRDEDAGPRVRERRQADYEDDDDQGGGRQRRGGWLGDLFDFGD